MWRGGKVLLVRREPGFLDTDFGLPGGRIEDDETAAQAAVRELREETGLRVTKVEYLFDYLEDWSADGNDYAAQRHSVCHVEVEGEVRYGTEIDRHLWWDMIAKVPVRKHMRPILEKVVETFPPGP